MHELTYQAMVMDIVRETRQIYEEAIDEESKELLWEKLEEDDEFSENLMRFNRFTYSKSEEEKDPKDKKKDVILNEDDKTWELYRHGHIVHLLTALEEAKTSLMEQKKNEIERLNKKLDKIGLDEKTTAQDARTFQNAINAMIGSDDILKNEVHAKLLSMGIQKFNEFNYTDICTLEQDLANGVDREGKALKRKVKVVREMTDIEAENVSEVETKIDTEEIKIIPDDKLFQEKLIPILVNEITTKADRQRLILLFQIFMEGTLSQEDLKILCQQSGLTDDWLKDIVLGYDQEFIKGNKIEKKEGQKEAQLRQLKNIGIAAGKFKRLPPGLDRAAREKECDHLNRWNPAVRDVFQYAANNILDRKIFHQVGNGTSEKSSSISSSQAQNTELKNSKKSNPKEKPRKTIIIYILGGLTFSEMRSVYEVSNMTEYMDPEERKLKKQKMIEEGVRTGLKNNSAWDGNKTKRLRARPLKKSSAQGDQNDEPQQQHIENNSNELQAAENPNDEQEENVNTDYLSKMKDNFTICDFYIGSDQRICTKELLLRYDNGE